MKVMLLYDVEGLGNQGEIVDVRPGYARNYLLARRRTKGPAEPKFLAVKPGKGAEKELALARRRAKLMEQKLVGEAQAVKKELERIPGIVLELRANEAGALYGSVTRDMIETALRTHKLKIDAKKIDIKTPIKTVGEYEIPIRLFRDIVHPLKVKIAATAQVRVEEKKAGTAEKKEPAKL